MNRTTTKRAMIPFAAATTLALSTLAGCGGQLGATTEEAAQQAALAPSTTTQQTAPASSNTTQPATAPASSAGQYADGAYQGSPVMIRWGAVQVQATIEGGKLTNVEFLTYPTGDRESQHINNQVAPMLVQEAIQAQSADVQVISGATFTCEAFMQSLQTALEQAA